jgi:hypothetical protein
MVIPEPNEKHKRGANQDAGELVDVMPIPEGEQ